MVKHSLLSVLKLSKLDVLSYIYKAKYLQKNGVQKIFPNKTLINMFYEPSTRTSCSFQAAALRLSCNVISLTDKISSAQKGESLEDTIRTLNCYGDVIVLRHPQKGSTTIADSVSRVPIINAGDGNGEHPTQALLDIYTIYTKMASYGIDLDNEDRNPLVVTFLGDLKNSRTIHSLIHILSMFPNIHFHYVAPPSLEMPPEIVERINELPNCRQTVSSNIEDVISMTDVLYVTRIQKERFNNEREYFSVVLNRDHQNKYCINKSTMECAKEKMIIMHPLPRLTEISTDIDDDPRAVYFQQVENGVYMRMAILDTIFSEN
jgi:aspartate carbamoyltransferase